MKSNKLTRARDYERESFTRINANIRPVYHMTPCVGWTNDPNGFSYYKGEYHLFYQSNPYDIVWDSMHWGHMVSKDLLNWEYRPCALAPDMPYDSFGCYSGSAIETADGKHLIIYTGVRKEGEAPGTDVQTQCIAIGDGTDYVKYEGNPVIDESFLPEGLSRNDFRDPKIWRAEDGTYRIVVGSRKLGKEGAILLFKSADGLKWEFVSTLIANDGRFGTMWECPDFFELDGKAVLMCSPMEMLPEGLEYHNGAGTLCLIGKLDETGTKFIYEHNQTIDYGIDFYASQSILAPDGRRIMIGWMQNWACQDDTGAKERGWFGQMTVPRELSVRNGRLYQVPVREIDSLRTNRIEYSAVPVTDRMTLDGVEGRIIDMEMTIRPATDDIYRKFTVNVAKNSKYHTEISFSPYDSILKVDRKFAGSRRAMIHQRRCVVDNDNGTIKLRILMDKYSIEVFVNDGEKAMTTVIWTDEDARDISFSADGKALLDIVKYNLVPATW